MKKWMLLIMTMVISLCVSLSTIAQTFTMDDLLHLKPGYAPVQNGKIKYYEFGNGEPPIVGIEGYASNLSYWNRFFLFDLAQKHRVVIFDNRNVGGSVIHSSAYTVADLADDTYQLIEYLRLHQAVIIGFSMGGMVAQQLAVSHPNAVSGLVLISTAIAGKEAVKPSLAVQSLLNHTAKNKMQQYATIIRLIAPPVWWPRVILTLAAERFLPIGQEEPLVTRQVLKQQRQLITEWTNNNALAEAIHHLNVPTLVLSGGKDGIIPPINSDILANAIPHAILIRWPQGGHVMTYQFPDEIAAAVNDFIANELPTGDIHSSNIAEETMQIN